MSVARRTTPERMDDPAIAPGELARALRDLRGVNRWLGGTRAAVRGVRALTGGPLPRTLLDVGTGSADIPLVLAGEARREGARLRAVGLDLHPLTVAEAARAARESAVGAAVRVVRGDAQRLPFADGAFEVAICCTTLHHFSRADATRVLREMGRVAQRGVMVTDLRRSLPGWIGALLLAATFWRRSLATRHDGPASVRAAFTPAEAREMAAAAGLRQVRVRRAALFRWTLVAAAAPGISPASPAGPGGSIAPPPGSRTTPPAPPATG
jgi:ubiquinone/menaquinone biosynthesis C-methylase UbiE